MLYINPNRPQKSQRKRVRQLFSTIEDTKGSLAAPETRQFIFRAVTPAPGATSRPGDRHTTCARALTHGSGTSHVRQSAEPRRVSAGRVLLQRHRVPVACVVDT